MKDRFGEINVAEMTCAFRHVSCTGLTTGQSVHHTLPWVHETPQLGAACFHGLRIADAALSD